MKTCVHTNLNGNKPSASSHPRRHVQVSGKSANMKCLSLAFIGLLVLIGVTNAAFEIHLCVDMSHQTPCKGWPAGLYPLCFGREHGYFARCEGNEATILPCPSVQDANGKRSRLLFDNATKTCVEKTNTSPERKSCVDMADFEPCKGLLDGKYHLCDRCELGYFAQCQNEKDVTIKPCPHIDDGNGGYRRLMFETFSQSCVDWTGPCVNDIWSR
ncbi:hypothetical protein PoB_003820200 [Plakobranchus ocellatus]|uniref:Chitin-binding type-2 domain-containing protein n=1 Tax=Plakobranchus ocellatus TaxID=259542 RepID=A0AAV4AXB2_9GAST|nr:hypothetical protein PoB_003820200 [Plakobranchus ocellatus]